MSKVTIIKGEGPTIVPVAAMQLQRFARQWRDVCVSLWPNLFPQPYMREA